MQTWLVFPQTVTCMYSSSVLMSRNTLHVIDQLLSEFSIIKVLLSKVDRQNSLTEENIPSQLKVFRLLPISLRSLNSFTCQTNVIIACFND